MNLVLLFDSDFMVRSSVNASNHPEQSEGSSQKVCLTGRRFVHIQEILKVKVGQVLSVGRLNGLIGQGQVINLGKNFLEMDVDLKLEPPKPLDLTLIMALPRPPMLKRTLQCAASLGIKKIIILHFAKVEKSLWQSSALKPEAIQEELILGLEQAKDTFLPEIILKKRFKPFVEDELPQLIKGKKALVVHPGETMPLPKAGKNEVVLVIGPEGGLTDFEVDLLKSKGVQGAHLGSRILRFENVIPYCVGKMY